MSAFEQLEDLVGADLRIMTRRQEPDPAVMKSRRGDRHGGSVGAKSQPYGNLFFRGRIVRAKDAGLPTRADGVEQPIPSVDKRAFHRGIFLTELTTEED